MSSPTDILRCFNEKGIAAFREYLAQARQSPGLPPPFELLTDADKASVLPNAIQIDRLGFKTKREVAEYLHDRLKPLLTAAIFKDVGLWSWLALYYFDDICPARSGKRKVLKDPHYILEPREWTRSYRHLLSSPFFILHSMPNHNKLFLDKEINVFGDVTEQLMSRFFVIRVGGVPEALERLYWDQVRKCAKRGITPKIAKKGDLRKRFPIRIDQLSLTYDISILSGPGLLTLLGKEFAGWLD